ncbi:MAG TPA: glucose-6-phosphate dehydrogenase [Firmicutes bacterium]|nr:glucose-6-phosphate dehydrogenase [Bacillota bacterium]
MNRTLPPCVFVIFGATGDLARRKLFPALYNLYAEGILPSRFAVVGVGRRLADQEAFLADVWAAIERFSRKINPELRESFLALIHYHRFDLADKTGFAQLAADLRRIDNERGTSGNRVYCLSVGPDQFEIVIDQLKEHRLVSNNDGAWQRVMVEKPFGRDLTTATNLNAKITGVFPEHSIFRIDHYLGKEMLQNLVAIRFANALFEPLWNSRYIDNVQLSVAESEGVGTRARYYESAGALRDVVQNHLLQMLTLVAMEPPVDLSSEAIRDEKVKVLRSLQPMTPAEIRRNTVRGQYGAGKIMGEAVPAYRDELNVAPQSTVETYAALRLEVPNFRWAGVPFYLRTGKRMPFRSAEIVIEFKSLPGVLYFRQQPPIAPNLLVIKVQPEEGVAIQFNTQGMGNNKGIIPVQMDFCQNCRFPSQSPEAYERLIADAILGDPTLFTRWDEVAHQWRYIDQIAAAWAENGAELPLYSAGSWGPEEADQLLRREGRRWHVYQPQNGSY